MSDTPREIVENNWDKVRYEEIDWDIIPEGWGRDDIPIEDGMFIRHYNRIPYENGHMLVMNVVDPHHFGDLVSFDLMQDDEIADMVMKKVEQEAALAAYNLGHTVYLLAETDGPLELRLYDTTSVFST